ncbi:MAG: hypothetical protein CR979_00745 [Propionibacterium sp.]|nr:MAG: hypothetical protein CR979_00745 [Propionibacterium sp.]
MSGLDFTSILDDLAAGRIDAAEAGRRIDAIKKAADSQETEATATDFTDDQEDLADQTYADKAAGNKGIKKLIVAAVGRRVRLEGDPAVATVSVDGPHVMRRHGSTLELTSNGEVGPSFDGFSLIRPPRSLEDLRDIGLGKELLVKVNPKIAVDIEVTTGGLNSKKIPIFGKVRVTAAGAELNDVAEVDDMLVQAGSGTVSGPISRGRSRVRVESGSLTITLMPGANVMVRGSSHLGRIYWPGEHTEGVDEVVIGNGSARLDIGVVMGMASIKDES